MLKTHTKQNINFQLTNEEIHQLNDSKAFIEYSNDMDVIHKNIEKNNPNKKRKILIVFDLIAEIISHKKLNVIAKESFIADPKNI